MTETLYLTDTYLRECDATVIEILERKYVVLDRTIFYPRGGGQPTDSGTLTVLPGGHGFRVLNVIKKDGKILHEIEVKPEIQEPLLKTQDPRPKTQDPRPKTQDPRPKTQDPRPWTQTPGPKTQDSRPKTT